MYKSRNILSAFLLLTSLVLVVNNAIPHHHHHQWVCFASDHCENEGARAVDGNPEHDLAHNHDHHTGELCKINGFYIIPDTKGHTHKAKSQRLQRIHLLFTIIPYESDEQIPSNKKSVFHQNNLLKIQTAKSLTRALRAPPTC